MSAAGHVVAQGEHSTEYSDGTEEVTFSEAEIAVMAADPVRFGYAYRCGHAIPFDRRNSPFGPGDCMECEAAMAGWECEA